MKNLMTMNNDEINAFQKSVKKDLNQSTRDLDRTLFRCEQSKKTCKKELEDAVKSKKDKSTCRIYASNFIKAKSNYENILNQKNKIKTMEFQINNIITEVKMTKSLNKNAELMKTINSLANVPELGKTLQNLQINLDKAGVISEEIEECLDEGDAEIDLDEEAEAMLNKLNGHYKIWDNEEMENNNNEDKIKNLEAL